MSQIEQLIERAVQRLRAATAADPIERLGLLLLARRDVEAAMAQAQVEALSLLAEREGR